MLEEIRRVYLSQGAITFPVKRSPKPLDALNYILAYCFVGASETSPSFCTDLIQTSRSRKSKFSGLRCRPRAELELPLSHASRNDVAHGIS